MVTVTAMEKSTSTVDGDVAAMARVTGEGECYGERG